MNGAVQNRVVFFATTLARTRIVVASNSMRLNTHKEI